MTRLWLTGEPITVSVDTEGQPRSFVWGGKSFQVAAIVQRWRVDTAWWEQRHWRDYVKLTTHTGELMLIYFDCVAQRWFLQRLYD